MPRELRVGDLVRPVRLPLDEVRNAAPAVRVDEDALVDDVVRPARIASAVTRAARSQSRSSVSMTRTLFPSARSCARYARSWSALAPDELGVRVVDVGPRKLPASDCEPKRREVLALEEVVQVRRREREGFGPHASIFAAGGQASHACGDSLKYVRLARRTHRLDPHADSNGVNGR